MKPGWGALGFPLEAKVGVSPVEGQAADPFGETTDPAVYVPRPAAEAALEAMVRGVTDRRIPALVGPPGIGKTLVLRRAAERLAERGWTPVFLPYASGPLEELCRWALGLLGAPVAEDPLESLTARAKAEATRGPGLLLAIDEADGLDRRAGDALGDLCWQSGGGLSLVLAASDDARGSRALASLGSDLEVVRLTTPLSEAETRAYVEGRLDQRGAPHGLAARFDDEAIAWIHRLSGGIPRRIHDVAGHLIEAAPDEVTPAWWKECQTSATAHLTEIAPESGDADEGRTLDPDDLDVPEIWVDDGEDLDEFEPEVD